MAERLSDGRVRLKDGRVLADGQVCSLKTALRIFYERRMGRNLTRVGACDVPNASATLRWKNLPKPPRVAAGKRVAPAPRPVSGGESEGITITRDGRVVRVVTRLRDSEALELVHLEHYRLISGLIDGVFDDTEIDTAYPGPHVGEITLTLRNDRAAERVAHGLVVAFRREDLPEVSPAVAGVVTDLWMAQTYQRPTRPGRATLPERPFTFWLGTHKPHWLAHAGVPLFVARQQFYRDGKLPKTFPRAKVPWALDSGGFTEITGHGEWRVRAKRYAAEVAWLAAEVGNLYWAAPMDWMVEPDAVKKTGLTIARHQEFTIGSFVVLRSRAPELPFVPVLQGWTLDDYLRHVDMYRAAGIDLAKEPLVGVGTMCRRTACPADIAAMLRKIRAATGAPLHAFGVKTQVLGSLADALIAQGDPSAHGAVASADSLAWSQIARLTAARGGGAMVPGHVHGTTNSCANCLQWALRWRDGVMAEAARYAAAARK